MKCCLLFVVVRCFFILHRSANQNIEIKGAHIHMAVAIWGFRNDPSIMLITNKIMKTRLKDEGCISISKKRCDGTFTSRYQIFHFFTSHPLKTRKSHKIEYVLLMDEDEKEDHVNSYITFFLN